MKHITRLFAFVVLVLGIQHSVDATHIRAGEITATLIDCQNYSYLFTITGYTDTGSTVQFGGGEIDFGDGRVLQLNTENFDLKQDLGNEIAINIFREEHTFPGPGTYTVTFREFNRNANVVNMDRSVDTPFYIETTITIDPLLGCNNTPVLTIPPVDGACTGVTFVHNPGAYDVDGDSLSYKIVIPKQNRDQPVNNYRYPNAEEFGGTQQDGSTPTLFTLDPVTGDLVWNSPGMAGEYNMAFIVEEWRKIGNRWVRLGYVTRDMQVIVEECENDPPEIILPEDTCVVAGAIIEKDILAVDPNGDKIKMESFGAVYNLDISPASYTPYFAPDASPIYQEDTAAIEFTWQTVCDHVRETPYQVRVKATDDGRPNLATFATWNIQVVGPAPTGLTASKATNRSIRLTWDDYACAGASEMQIWRRVGSNPFEPGACEVGMPEGAGYELIGTVPIGDDEFIDDDNGDGLSFGADYCYRIVAVFPAPRGGESIVSEEVCEYIEITSPVITNVSVEETSDADGEIFVRWTRPLEIDQAVFPPPYTYTLYRGTGLTGTGAGIEIASNISENDTTFTDTGLNTLDLAYHYFIELQDANNTTVDTSEVASSVRLELSPQVGAIGLEWEAVVPWSNVSPDFPNHLIYRDNVDPANPDALVLIDEVNVLSDGFLYLDDGASSGGSLDEDTEYCYYVTTRGTYGNPLILDPLENNSQVACAQPNDTIAPCTPIAISFDEFNSPDECEEFMRMQTCEFNDFKNTLLWSPQLTGTCDDDIRGYNVYFSADGSENYEFIGFTRDTSYVHDGLSSFAGCYRVSAVDRSGNESAFSEAICKDNCPQYFLPNVMTPNGDGKNDTFRALARSSEETCPWFVESVTFKVFNRWGVEVFDSEAQTNLEQSIYINWEGITNDGQKVSSGVYYYLAEVTFNVLNPAERVQQLKGWIHILDEAQ